MSAIHPTDLCVRSTRHSDVQPLTLLLNEVIEVGGSTAFEEPLTESEFAEEFVSGCDVLFCHIVVSASNDDPLGFQVVSRHAELPGTWGDIATFSRVEPKVQGVGTIVFPWTLQRAKEKSLVAINAEIRADNVSGLAYYAKMGFVTYGVRDAVPLRDGTPVDRILKRYDIA